MAWKNERFADDSERESFLWQSEHSKSSANNADKAFFINIH